jgi:hypothetical protein
MRRFTLLLALAVALVVPAGAAASTTHESFPFDTEFALCNGDTIHLHGTIVAVFTETSTPSGGFKISSHFQPRNVIGVDERTGTIFHAVGLTRDIVIVTPKGGYVETLVNRFHIQATGGAQSYIVTETFHITVTAAGKIATLIDFSSGPC